MLIPIHIHIPVSVSICKNILTNIVLDFFWWFVLYLEFYLTNPDSIRINHLNYNEGVF